MTAEQPEKIIVECTACARKLRLAASSAGKRFKCPKCGEVNTVPIADPTPVIAEELDLGVPLSQSPEEELQIADSIPQTPAFASVPTSQAALEPEGKKQSGGLLRMLLRASLLRGCVLSSVAAIVGAIAWCVIAVITDYEIGYLAWGIGIATGIMMAFGYQARSMSAGAIAAALAVFGIFLGKLLTAWTVLMPNLDHQLRTQDPRIYQLAVHHMLVEGMHRGLHPLDEASEGLFVQQAEVLAALSDEELDQKTVELESWENGERDDDLEYVRVALIYHLIAHEVDGPGYDGQRVLEVSLEEWPDRYAAAKAKVADIPQSEQLSMLTEFRAKSEHYQTVKTLAQRRANKAAILAHLAYADERRNELYEQECDAVFDLSESEFKKAQEEANAWDSGDQWNDAQYTRNLVIFTIIDNRLDEQIEAAGENSEYNPYEMVGTEWEAAWTEAAKEIEGESEQEIRERARQIVADQEEAVSEYPAATSKAEAIAKTTPRLVEAIIDSLDPWDYIFFLLALISAYGIAARESENE